MPDLDPYVRQHQSYRRAQDISTLLAGIQQPEGSGRPLTVVDAFVL